MVFINIASAVFIAWTVVFGYVSDNWKLGIDPQVVKCLPQDYFVISRKAPQAVERGVMYEYEARGLAPVMKDGTRLVKIAAGVPGDTVRVDVTGIYINDRKWGDLNPAVMAKTHWALESLTKTYVLGPGEVLLLGTLPRSYDGRYFGPVRISQLRGRAYFAW